MNSTRPTNKWSKNHAWSSSGKECSTKQIPANGDDNWGDWSSPAGNKSTLDLLEFDTLTNLESKKTDILRRNET